jgi:hypothetical protein
MTATLVSQETARWTLREFDLDNVTDRPRAMYGPPPDGVRGLMIAAAHLEDRALVRLDMCFPEITAAVNLTRTPEGVEVLRAIAKNGVPS